MEKRTEPDYDATDGFIRMASEQAEPVPPDTQGAPVSAVSKLLARILEHDEEMEVLRRKRADCVSAWEKATGRRYMPGPPTPPEPPDERPVS